MSKKLNNSTNSETNFIFKWNEHNNKLLSTIHELFQNSKFTDVNLVYEYAKIKAHKLILSACSEYLEHLLKQNSCTIFIKGISSCMPTSYSEFYLHRNYHSKKGRVRRIY